MSNTRLTKIYCRDPSQCDTSALQLLSVSASNSEYAFTFHVKTNVYVKIG